METQQLRPITELLREDHVRGEREVAGLTQVKVVRGRPERKMREKHVSWQVQSLCKAQNKGTQSGNSDSLKRARAQCKR